MPTRHLDVKSSSLPLPRSTLKLVWFCTSWSDPAKQTSDAVNFLRALEGKRLIGQATIPVCGESRALTNDNIDEAIDWFGAMVTSYLRRQSIKPPFFVIPMPDTNTTLESSAGPWTSLMAMAIAAGFEEDVEMLDVLRWKKSLSSLGSQANDPVRLCENLVVLGNAVWDRPVVLVDFLANPTRACACEAFLRAQGARALLCIAAGRIVAENPPKPFAVFRVEVPGIDPHSPPPPLTDRRHEP